MKWALAALIILGSRDAVALGAAPTVKECIGANESAIKHRAALELRAARTDLLVCAAVSCPAAIQTECGRRLEDVDRATPSLVFAADDGAGTDLADVKVTLDGVLLAERLEAIAVDPGKHEVRFEVSGFQPVSRTIIVREGEKNRRERAVFAHEIVTPNKGGKSPGWRIAGITTAGAGVVGLVVSGIFAGLAASSWSSAQSACPSAASCPDHPKAVTDHDAASTDATISTIALIAGAGLVATGAIVFFAAPTTGSRGAVVGVGATF